LVMKDITDIKGKAADAMSKNVPLISRSDFIAQFLQ